MRARKRVLLGVILIATVIGAVHLASLGRAAGPAPSADDDCRLFSCIFGDAGDVD
ncbi:MAG TPA: hypothetical protein VMH36_16875 [Alphaproteobacteria bacterium]|nr:hypothetical protein [Alphaproteobacteria bacterium]